MPYLQQGDTPLPDMIAIFVIKNDKHGRAVRPDKSYLCYLYLESYFTVIYQRYWSFILRFRNLLFSYSEMYHSCRDSVRTERDGFNL